MILTDHSFITRRGPNTHVGPMGPLARKGASPAAGDFAPRGILSNTIPPNASPLRAPIKGCAPIKGRARAGIQIDPIGGFAGLDRIINSADDDARLGDARLGQTQWFASTVHHVSVSGDNSLTQDAGGKAAGTGGDLVFGRARNDFQGAVV